MADIDRHVREACEHIAEAKHHICCWSLERGQREKHRCGRCCECGRWYDPTSAGPIIGSSCG